MHGHVSIVQLQVNPAAVAISHPCVNGGIVSHAAPHPVSGMVLSVAAAATARPSRTSRSNSSPLSYVVADVLTDVIFAPVRT
jgi:hypothetical protein